jgi:hypothetical protein
VVALLCGIGGSWSSLLLILFIQHCFVMTVPSALVWLIGLITIFIVEGCAEKGCKRWGTRTIYFDYCGDRKGPPSKVEGRRADYFHKL